MINKANKLLGACGLYCGACYHYRASLYTSERLYQEAARRGRDVQGFSARDANRISFIFTPVVHNVKSGSVQLKETFLIVDYARSSHAGA